MQTVKNIWTWATVQRQISIAICCAVFFAGVLVIAVGAAGDIGWTRIVGATLITVGSVLAGTLIGWAEPLQSRFQGHVWDWRQILVLLLAAVFVLPLLLGLIFAIGGVIVAGASLQWYTLLIGILIALSLIALTLLTTGTALVGSIRGLDATKTDSANNSSRQAEQ